MLVRNGKNGCRVITMQKILSLALTFVLVFAALALTGCSSSEDSGANVVSVEPPKDAKLQPTDMGGGANGASGGKAASGTAELPPP